MIIWANSFAAITDGILNKAGKPILIVSDWGVYEKNSYILIALLLFLTINCVKAQIKADIFAGNIFDGISTSPDYYKDKDFIIKKNIPEIGDYSARSGANLIVTVENSEIKITYWKFDNTFRINSLRIKNKTKLCVWGKYIGEKSENIFGYFSNTPYYNADDSIRYGSSDAQYTLNFKTENNLVYEIFIGVNP